MRLAGRWTISGGAAYLMDTRIRDWRPIPYVSLRDGLFVVWLGFWVNIMRW